MASTQVCGVGTYSAAVAATGPETCVECFPLRTSPEGSTHEANCSCFDLYFENKVGPHFLNPKP